MSKDVLLPELYEATGMKELKKMQDLITILNRPPKQEWIVKHNNINDYHYIPIERIEWLLTSIFTEWRLEVRDYKQIINSVSVHVRLHVKNPITGQWDWWQDGLGASPIQTEKGAGPVDLDKILSAGVQMSLPAAESYALSDAAEKFGKIFGKDINRKHGMIYGNLAERDVEKLKTKLSEMIGFCQDNDLKQSVLDQLIVIEDKGRADAEFYLTMINKLEGNVSN
jgi:hypothetical protein